MQLGEADLFESTDVSLVHFQHSNDLLVHIRHLRTKTQELGELCSHVTLRQSR